MVDKSGGGYSSVYLPPGYRKAQFGGGANCEIGYDVGLYFFLSVGQAMPVLWNVYGLKEDSEVKSEAVSIQRYHC